MNVVISCHVSIKMNREVSVKKANAENIISVLKLPAAVLITSKGRRNLTRNKVRLDFAVCVSFR